MGLARLWQSWGIEPDVVLGHSVGQYSAACVAGVFGLEDGALLIAERGRLFGSLPAGGRMVAVFADADRVESCTDEFPRLSVAAYNGANTVLSGPAEDLERAVAELTADGVRCEWLDTSHAFHSALLDPVLDEFESYACGFEFGRRSGHWCAIAPAWPSAGRRNWTPSTGAGMRGSRSNSPRACATLAELGCAVLLEVGPQPVLTAAALRAWPDTERRPQAIASLRRRGSDQRQISEALAPAYVAGHRPDFAAAAAVTGRKVDLPTYPFQHRKYWYSTSPTIRAPADAVRTETVRLLEEGRIDELAALVGAATGDDQTVGALKQLAAQHNQQRSAQTIADARYEIGWEKSADYGFGTRTDRGADLASDRRRCRNRCAACRPADRTRAPAPDRGDAGIGRRRRAARGRAARRRGRATRAAHRASGRSRPGRCNVGTVAGSDAAPSPEWNAAGPPGRARRRARGTHLAGHPRRTTGDAGRHRLPRAVHACGASVAPRPTNIPNCGVGSRTCLRADADDWSGLVAHILARTGGRRPDRAPGWRRLLCPAVPAPSSADDAHRSNYAVTQPIW